MQRILIVDDQGVTRLILDEFLRSLNLELQVEVFWSPLAALEWAAATRWTWQLSTTACRRWTVSS